MQFSRAFYVQTTLVPHSATILRACLQVSESVEVLSRHHGALSEGGAFRTPQRLIEPYRTPRDADADPSCKQADIQMMLAAQCHLGTKCVTRADARGPAGSRAVPAHTLGSAFDLPAVRVLFHAAWRKFAAFRRVGCVLLLRNCDFQMERYTWRRRTADGACSG